MAIDNSQSQEVDLDRTDKLPILDGALIDDDVADDAVRMDYTASLPTMRPDFPRPAGVDLPSLAESVRSVEERIARQNAEYEALNHSYLRALDAEAAAVARSQALAADLTALRAALEAEQSRTREMDRALAERIAAADSTRTRVEEALREAERYQGESHTLRDTLAARDASLAQVLHSLGERDAQLTALQAEHAKIVPALEERSRRGALVEADLRAARARAEVMAAELKSTQQSVAALTAQLQRGEAELEATRRDLSVLKGQASAYLESLRTNEWRHGFDQNLFRDLDAQIGAAHDSHGTLQAERNELRDKVAALESKLAARDKSIGELKAASAADETRRAKLEQHLHAMDGARAELTQKISALDAERGRLNDIVAARDRSIAELKAAAAADEAQRAKLEQHLHWMDGARAGLSEKIAALESERGRLTEVLASREGSIAELKTAAAAGETRRAELAERLHAMDGVRTELGEKITALDGERSRLTEQLAARDKAIADLTAAAAADLALRKQREQELQALDGARIDLKAQITALEGERAHLHRELAAKDRAIDEALAAGVTEAERLQEALSAADQAQAGLSAQVRQLESEAAARHEEIAVLAAHLEEARRPIQSIEADVKRLTDELAAKSHMIDTLTEENRSLQLTVERTRGALEEREFLIRRLERSESNNANVLGRIQTSIERLGIPAANLTGTNTPLPVECTAELARIDGEHNTSHMLARRTRIGRAPGCELQIESSSVSRHHALVLVGQRDVIIEDLNSTNGVLVNGRKISRLQLNDGDMITIGEAQFRFNLTLTPRVLEAPGASSP